MAFTYAIATDRGKVRLLIPDRLATQYMFEDDEIDWFLTAEGSVIKKAAALALETMASDEAYVQKFIKLMDLSTNGPAVADALMKRAGLLRAQADAEAEDALGDDEFTYAEWVVNDFSGWERLDKEALRSG